MKIFGYKTIQTFPENPNRQSFISSIALNSAIETLKTNKRMSILPAGSWITGKGYDPVLSDHDMTFLIPSNSPYHKMEADIYDAKECMKETVLKKLKFHKVPENTIYNQILPSINVFPTPQVQNCFNSYQQFRDFTNLKISLHNKIDPDKGLWQMKELLSRFFENEGNLLYFTKDGSFRFINIKQNKSEFFKHIKQRSIYMPKESTLYYSQKLKIINEFIDIMQKNTEMSTKSFFKYLLRVKKFFVIDAENDLFLIADDARKNSQEKFRKRIKTEKEFQELYNKIFRKFNESKISQQAFLPEQFAKSTLKDLKLFKELAVEILKGPSLKGFKVH